MRTALMSPRLGHIPFGFDSLGSLVQLPVQGFSSSLHIIELDFCRSSIVR